MKDTGTVHVVESWISGLDVGVAALVLKDRIKCESCVVLEELSLWIARQNKDVELYLAAIPMNGDELSTATWFLGALVEPSLVEKEHLFPQLIDVRTDYAKLFPKSPKEPGWMGPGGSSSSGGPEGEDFAGMVPWSSLKKN